MINNVFSNSPFIEIYNPPPNYVSSNANSGSLRFNTSNQQLEVYDGSYWKLIGRDVQVNASLDLQRVINWAKIKMDEEERMRQKAALFPTIRDALDELNKAKEKLEVLDKLCDEKELGNAQKAA